MIYFVSIVALLAFVCYVWSTSVPYSEAMREIERKSRAEEEARRNAWLETPEGQTHQRAQQRAAETQRRWAAERIEAERSAAQVERINQERRLQHRAREQQRLQKVEEETARAEWDAFFESKTIDAIASMTGLEFEKFLARLLPHLAYRDISLTGINDQGGDILCTSGDGDRVVVQAKRWKGAVGNSAVQEVLGAMLHYGCTVGVVITNSTFTTAAKTLASKDPRIVLCDGSWLKEQVARCLPPVVPPFDRERYEREVKPFAGRGSDEISIVAVESNGRLFGSINEILAAVASGELPVEVAQKKICATELKYEEKIKLLQDADRARAEYRRMRFGSMGEIFAAVASGELPVEEAKKEIFARYGCGLGDLTHEELLLGLKETDRAHAEGRQMKIQAEARAFNDKYPVGSQVRYWTAGFVGFHDCTAPRAPGEGEGILSRTTSEAKMIGDYAAVAVEACRVDFVALTHVQVIPG